MNIHVRPRDEEQFQEILDTLRPLGVELVTAEDDPLVAALLYVARMNSKLDNLGQLGHLNKIQKVLCSASAKVEEVLTDEILHRQAQHALKAYVYRRLKEETGLDPIKTLNLNLDPQYLSEDQIIALFTVPQ